MSAEQEKIKDLAYRLWQESGSPHGRDQDFWFDAEAQVKAAKAPAKPKVAKPEAAKAPAKAKEAPAAEKAKPAKPPAKPKAPAKARP